MEVDFDRDSRFWLGLYESELTGAVRDLCRPGTAAFDLGSESGYYALVFARLGGGRVLAVEADVTTAERLRRNVAANPGLAPRIEVREARVAQHADGAAVSLDHLAYGDAGFVPDLVKLDVEGSEVRALLGARRLLAERRPHVIVETHSADLDDACAELLADSGYAVEPVQPRRVLGEVRTVAFNRWLVARGEPRRP